MEGVTFQPVPMSLLMDVCHSKGMMHSSSLPGAAVVKKVRLNSINKWAMYYWYVLQSP